MRGKGPFIFSVKQMLGITPAYAGKRNISLPAKMIWWDHPRLCGEKASRNDFPNIVKGSPPPMRGKVRLLYHRGEFFRITPAYAGKR